MKECIANIIATMLMDLTITTMIIFTCGTIWTTVSIMLAAKMWWSTGIFLSGSFFCLTVALVMARDLILDIFLIKEE